jgi:hypothetical protein
MNSGNSNATHLSPTGKSRVARVLLSHPPFRLRLQVCEGCKCRVPKKPTRGDVLVVRIVRIEEHLDITRRFIGAQAVADEERDRVSHFVRERLNPVAIRTIGLYFFLLEGHDDRRSGRVGGD